MRFRKRSAQSLPAALDRRLLLRDWEPLELPEGETVTLQEDLDADILSRRLDDGRTMVPAFTSETELLAWNPAGGPYVALQGRRVGEIVHAHGFDLLVVDPAGNAVELDRQALGAVRDRSE